MIKRDTVSLIFFDEDFRILLQHRTDDAPVFPSYWGLFGGKIKKNEVPKKTIIREILEEINYKLINPKYVLTLKYKDVEQNNSGKKYYFTEKCLSKSNLRLNEGQDMRWFTYKEILNLKIIDHNLEAIKKIFPIIKKTS